MARAEVAKATRIPANDARLPQSALPTARLACVATRFVDTARARTHAGAELWIPADRPPSTQTHAAPPKQAATIATGVVSAAAIKPTANVHASMPHVTTAFNGMRFS